MEEVRDMARAAKLFSQLHSEDRERALAMPRARGMESGANARRPRSGASGASPTAGKLLAELRGIIEKHPEWELTGPTGEDPTVPFQLHGEHFSTDLTGKHAGKVLIVRDLMDGREFSRILGLVRSNPGVAVVGEESRKPAESAYIPATHLTQALVDRIREAQTPLSCPIRKK